MIAVIQCAASKRVNAGRLATGDGKPVEFVASPADAPDDPAVHYSRPDDLSDQGPTWREVVVQYNREPDGNPRGLYPAYRLYENAAYARLVNYFGVERVYILSAGWGLIGANFLTPYYDITFSQSAEKYKYRKHTDHYDDFRMLASDTSSPVVFFGGKNYVPLFCFLTSGMKSVRTVFYNSASPPMAPGCVLKRFNTKTRTNWHYECASAFISGFGYSASSG